MVNAGFHIIHGCYGYYWVDEFAPYYTPTYDSMSTLDHILPDSPCLQIIYRFLSSQATKYPLCLLQIISEVVPKSIKKWSTVVEPTPLKKIWVKLGIFFKVGMNIQDIWVAATYNDHGSSFEYCYRWNIWSLQLKKTNSTSKPTKTNRGWTPQNPPTKNPVEVANSSSKANIKYILF